MDNLCFLDTPEGDLTQQSKQSWDWCAVDCTSALATERFAATFAAKGVLSGPAASPFFLSLLRSWTRFTGLRVVLMMENVVLLVLSCW